jgi:hypothetical protein
MNKIKLMGKNHDDIIYTPPYVTKLLIPYINKDWVIWECAAGNLNISKVFEEQGFIVHSTDILNGVDFLKDPLPNIKYDCIITNPPYSIKDKFLERCYGLNKPFALLLPITALEGIKRQELYKKYGVQLIMPRGRVDFKKDIYKKSGNWFYSCWFCWKLNLPKDLTFLGEEIK